MKKILVRREGGGDTYKPKESKRMLRIGFRVEAMICVGLLPKKPLPFLRHKLFLSIEGRIKHIVVYMNLTSTYFNKGI